MLTKDPPWPCNFTHRVHIHLDRLWRDVRDSVIAAGGYLEALSANPQVLRNFERAMEDLYPR